MKPTVTLVSHTDNPVGTIYALWQASRNNEPAPNPKDISPDNPAALEIFKKVFNSQIPVSENLNFIFLIEGISISLREQLVRHKVGTKVGDRIGIDTVPELGGSAFWSQTMRVLDMGRFYEQGNYRMPDSVSVSGKRSTIYRNAIKSSQDAYNQLIELGTPIEDARDVLPLATGHRISWSINLRTLQQVIGKRSCWIAQSGIWEPIIFGMVNELATKVHPYFRNLINPPCIKDDKFVGCCYNLENERRVDGRDPLPPCTLYLDENKIAEHRDREDLKTMAVKYANIWDRNPYSGSRR